MRSERNRKIKMHGIPWRSVKNPPANVGDTSSIPGQEDPMCAMEHLSPRTSVTEPACCSC